MDTEELQSVSYLTINGITKEIADKLCREKIQAIEDKFEVFNILTDLISDPSNFIFNKNNYKQLSIIAQSGKASEYLNIGDQIVVPWQFSEDTSYNLLFDVVAINSPIINENNENITSNVWLQSHYVLPTMPFSGRNAFYVTDETILSGTTYYFTMGDSGINYLQKNTNYQFTVPQDIPIGGQFILDSDSTSATITIYESAFSNETNPSKTTVIQGDSGNYLGILNNSSIKMNCLDYIGAGKGCNRYCYSVPRQWLNSNQDRGQWWQPLNKFERRHSFSQDNRGFMAGLPQEFLNIVKPVQVPTFTSIANTIDYTYDYFFLPSWQQMGLLVRGASATSFLEDKEGQTLSYWQDKVKEDRIRYLYNNQSNATGYHLRSIYNSKTNLWQKRYVSSTGIGNATGSSMSTYYGITPICVIY